MNKKFASKNNESYREQNRKFDCMFSAKNFYTTRTSLRTYIFFETSMISLKREITKNPLSNNRSSDQRSIDNHDISRVVIIYRRSF